MKESGQPVAKYSYDAFNRRLRKTVTSPSPVPPEAGHPLPQGEREVRKEYVYDGWQEIGEYVDGRPSKEFVFSQRLDEPVVMIDYNGEQKRYFYQTDRLGSVTALTDGRGEVVERYRYDAYGAPIQLAKDSEKTGGIANPFRYTGRYFDNETGLYYYRNRYYSPELGRFVTRDPVKYFDGMNLYAYVNNQPTYFVDPMGLWSEEIHNQIIDYVFSNKIDKIGFATSQMKRGSADADRFKYQDEEHSYMHAMRRSGEAEPMTQMAQRQMEQFISTEINVASDLMAQGRQSEAYFHFGRAIHPLMDSTSPAHEGFQVWEGMSHCFNPFGGTSDCLEHHERESSFLQVPKERTKNLLITAWEDMVQKAYRKRKKGQYQGNFLNSEEPVYATPNF